MQKTRWPGLGWWQRGEENETNSRICLGYGKNRFVAGSPGGVWLCRQ